MKVYDKVIPIVETINRLGLDNTQWVDVTLRGETCEDIIKDAEQKVCREYVVVGSTDTDKWPKNGKWIAIWFEDESDSKQFPTAEMDFLTYIGTRTVNIKLYLVADLEEEN